jgi:hypothetical protein
MTSDTTGWPFFQDLLVSLMLKYAASSVAMVGKRESKRASMLAAYLPHVSTWIKQSAHRPFLVGRVLRVGRKAKADRRVGEFPPSVAVNSERVHIFERSLHLWSTLANIVSQQVRNRARTMGRSTSSLRWPVLPPSRGAFYNSAGKPQSLQVPQVRNQSLIPHGSKKFRQAVTPFSPKCYKSRHRLQ